MELSFDLLLILFGVATIAGFIDAIAGGGGLLTIPALLSAGIPPAMALGTNKLQACGGSFSASLYFIRQKAVDLKQIWLLLLLTFIGATFGTILVQMLDVEALKSVLPFLILLIGFYFLFTPNVGDSERKPIRCLRLVPHSASVFMMVYSGRQPVRFLL